RLGGWCDPEKKELAPGFSISDGDVVIDVGSGDGGMAKFCAECGADVILIDRDRSRIDQAIAAVNVAGKARGLVADAVKLPFASGSAGRVICTEVLEHVDDPAAVMTELARIGSPNALYLLSVPGMESEDLQKQLAPPIYFEKPNHIRIFDDETFTR